MHYLWIILIQTQTHISANEDQFRLVREQKIAPMAPSHLQLWLPVVYWCDLSEVNDGCVACNSKIITSWCIWPYLAYILHAAAPMTCQAVVGKNRWSQRLKLRMSRKGTASGSTSEMEGVLYCESAWSAPGPDVPLDRPLEWRAVLPAVPVPTAHAAICW